MSKREILKQQSDFLLYTSKEDELQKGSTAEEFSVVRTEEMMQVEQNPHFYNLNATTNKLHRSKFS